MRSPYTALPFLTIARVPTGWLASCNCGFQRPCGSRVAADSVANEHLKEHAPKTWNEAPNE